MILFDIICPDDHVFEAWFPDSAAFEKQRKTGKIACPVCGATKVAKALMAPNISVKKEDSSLKNKEAMDAMKILYNMRAHIEEKFDYVGSGFAEEARKIHYDEVEKRDIYGEATVEEVEDLRDEGIEFGEIPWVPTHDA